MAEPEAEVREITAEELYKELAQRSQDLLGKSAEEVIRMAAIGRISPSDAVEARIRPLIFLLTADSFRRSA
jgi:hypothetical protein